MESLKAKMAAFIERSGSDYSYGHGSGYGDGSGDSYSSDDYDDGYGDGTGSGYGHSRGQGLGCGTGTGFGCYDDSGYGFGYGEDIKSFCDEEVHYIDGFPTIIRAVRGNVARGLLIGEDLTTSVCYVVKQDGVFAHGVTLKKAIAALRDKFLENISEEERIEAFMREHELGVKYSAADLYDWHHRLTGSCEAGRQQFAKDHNININHNMLTIEEFIELTKDAYGGDVIRKLANLYDIK